tara:strand:- start:15382 stop:16026 length:645 start_codon:yes stop_codon:yes gene_type:complete
MPQSLVTPKGESVFACILGEPRLNQFNGQREYTMGMRYKPEDCKNLIKQIDDQYTEAHGKKKPAAHGLPYEFESFTDENGEEKQTGYIKFKFKRKELSRNGEPLGAPKVVDANLRPWDQEKLIGNGSIVRTSFTIFPYDQGGCGVGLFLKGVQVLKHVEYDPDANIFSVDEEFADEETDFEAVGTPSSLNVDSSNAECQINKAAANINQEDIPF